MFGLIVKNDAKNLLRLADETVLSGYDPLNIATDLQEYIRNVMLYKVSPESVTTISDLERIKSFSGILSIDILLRLIQMLSDCVYQMRNAEQPIMVLEVFCVKLTQKYVGLDELINRLENLESSSGIPAKSGQSGIEEEAEDDKKLPARPLRPPCREAGQSENEASQSSSGVPAHFASSIKRDESRTVQNLATQIPIEKIRTAWSEVSRDAKIRPRILTCFSETNIAYRNGGNLVIEFGDAYKMETVLSNKSVWLPLMEQKLGGRFEFTAEIVPNIALNNPEIDVEEEENPSSEIFTNGESEVAGSSTGKDTAVEDKKSDVHGKQDSPTAVKNIIDLFGGGIVEE